MNHVRLAVFAVLVLGGCGAGTCSDKLMIPSFTAVLVDASQKPVRGDLVRFSLNGGEVRNAVCADNGCSKWQPDIERDGTYDIFATVGGAEQHQQVQARRPCSEEACCHITPASAVFVF